MNLIILSGRITKDSELSFIPNSGVAKLVFDLAVDRNYQKDKNNKKVDFIRCEMLGKGGESLCQYLTKGKAIVVNGELNIDNYKDKEGNNKSFTKVLVNRVEFQQGSVGDKKTDANEFTNVEIDSSDIPF
ncbi:single-stranded DNA-binding protein [Clostridium sp.]|uniref:single-stranded DNA-binding protein n=1 Tax=Clostridium sp. TaxID=1506 RepID=UPI003F375D55